LITRSAITASISANDSDSPATAALNTTVISKDSR